MNNAHNIIVAASLAIAAGQGAAQQPAAGHAAHHPQAQAQAQTAPAAGVAEGEVRRVDKAQKKITLRHGEIKNLDMPPMTMVFGVAKPELLDAVKIGDKVRFRAIDSGGGALVLTEIAPAN